MAHVMFYFIIHNISKTKDLKLKSCGSNEFSNSEWRWTKSLTRNLDKLSQALSHESRDLVLGYREKQVDINSHTLLPSVRRQKKMMSKERYRERPINLTFPSSITDEQISEHENAFSSAFA